MDLLLLGIPWYITAIILVILINLLIYLGFRLVRKNIPSEKIRVNHDVASYTLNILGLIYAVLIGFTVVNVQNRFDAVDRNVLTEANILLNLYRDASVFPEENRDEIRTQIRSYVDRVVTHEWAAMENHQENMLHSPVHLHRLWKAYYDVNIENDKVHSWYQLSIDKLNDLSNVRLQRLFSSQQSLGTFMWTILLAGGVSLVLFMYFFSTPNFAAQLFMACIVAGNIVFMLYLIYSLDTVFTGSIRVEPKAFELLHQSFDLWDQASI